MRTALGPILVVLGVMTGCGKVDGAAPDGRVIDSAMPDPPVTCNPLGVFGTPRPLAGYATPGFEAIARLSYDELTMIYTGHLDSPTHHLYMATRSHRSEPFGPPARLSINSTFAEADPTLSRDGLLLIFASTRSDGVDRLYTASRATPVGDFATPTPVLGVASATTTEADGQPYLTSDGQELWFTSTRSGGVGSADIFRAARSGGSFSAPVRVLELSSSSEDWLPVISEDRLTIYWSSTRPGGLGGFDIWRSHRSTTADGWGTPVLVPELNSMASDYAAWLSPDGCRMYMTSDWSGNWDILVAERQP